jgi:hypothetical protein
MDRCQAQVVGPRDPGKAGVVTRRRLLLTGCVVLSIATGGAGSIAGAATPEWRLVGHHQRACYDTNVHDAWYGVFINGTWTHPITVGVDKLPTGGSYTTSYTPIPPGSANGRYTLAYADVRLPSSTAVGTYRPVLWASDGSARSRVRIELDVKSGCGY